MISRLSLAGVVPLAHTPLAKGLATGVYTASNPTGGKMGAPKYEFSDLSPLTPIHTALVAVSQYATVVPCHMTFRLPDFSLL